MLYAYAQVCLYDNNVCVVYMHVWGAVCVCAQCLYLGSVYMYVLPIRAMFELWGSVCMLCNAHVCLCEQLLLCISVTVEGSVCFCVLNACISVCGGSVCVVCMYTHVVCEQ